jgi:glucose/arabinose dehydrogenase
MEWFLRTFDRNLIGLRALQEPLQGPGDNQAPASHNGGVLRFGPDGKLYIAVGDVGPPRTSRRSSPTGFRNPRGMAFDPASGNLWLEENGEDSFSELHRIEPGQNGGWAQIRGPLSRIAQYMEIEISSVFYRSALSFPNWSRAAFRLIG